MMTLQFKKIALKKVHYFRCTTSKYSFRENFGMLFWYVDNQNWFHYLKIIFIWPFSPHRISMIKTFSHTWKCHMTSYFLDNSSNMESNPFVFFCPRIILAHEIYIFQLEASLIITSKVENDKNLFSHPHLLIELKVTYEETKYITQFQDSPEDDSKLSSSVITYLCTTFNFNFHFQTILQNENCQISLGNESTLFTFCFVAVRSRRHLFRWCFFTKKKFNYKFIHLVHKITFLDYENGI